MVLPVANTASYELMLPSQQKTVKYRAFLVKEEKILLMAMESGDSQEMLNAIKNIVEACTFGELKADEYPMFDLEYVFLQIRAKSVGETSKIKLLCPDDKKTYVDTEIDLSKIEVYVDDDHSPNILIDEGRKLGVVMKYPTLKEVDPKILEGDKVFLAKDTPKKEIEEFVEGLTADQMRKLSAFYNSMPRLEHKVKVKNPKTEVESEVTLKGLASFFG